MERTPEELAAAINKRAKSLERLPLAENLRGSIASLGVFMEACIIEADKIVRKELVYENAELRSQAVKEVAIEMFRTLMLSMQAIPQPQPRRVISPDIIPQMTKV